MVLLETERLLLRPLNWEDLEDLACIYADPRVTRYISTTGLPRSREETISFLQRITTAEKERGLSLWAFVLKATGHLIGRGGPSFQEVEGQEELEIGWALAYNYWGKGLASEAARAARDYLLWDLGWERLISIIDPPNIASQRVAERLGSVYERDAVAFGKTCRIYALHKQGRIPERVKTARLIGQSPRWSDFQELDQLHQDPRVMATLSVDGQPLGRGESLRRYWDVRDPWSRLGYGLWMFREQASGAWVGYAGLAPRQVEGVERVGLHYAVRAEFWGQGLATEMGSLALQVGFEHLRLPEIGCWTLPENRASQRVMEKLGFTVQRPITYAGLPHLYYQLSVANFGGIPN
ncbi:MAG: GNAT family N-acetyltransferase [Thermostichus sp. BF3_bins_97]